MTDKIKQAFIDGVKFAIEKKIREEMKGRAYDAAQWVTLHPNKSAGAKGRPALIDSATGQILGGALPKSVHGTNIKDLKNTFKQQKAAKAKTAAPVAAPAPAAPSVQAKKPAAQIDLSLPDKIDKNLILQNRDRSTAASIKQIRDIAQKPDYMLLSGTRTLADGAPVVAYGKIPPENMGNVDMAVGGGNRYKVQYAVMSADDIVTSHNAQGQPIAEYSSDDPNKTRAIAGNGRMTALRYAYNQGLDGVQTYKQEMLEDRSHGIDPKVIEKIKNPVLVRVMQPKDVTADIGDKTNTASNMRMSAVEQARNDTNRVNFEDVKTYDDGTPTAESIVDFIKKMPVSEQGELIDTDGQPTAQAERRLEAALFTKAYNNDNLTRLKAQALDPDSKNLINALTIAAPAMAKLEELPDRNFDIREIVSKATSSAVAHLRAGHPLKDLALNTEDMFETGEDNSAVKEIHRLFANNPRSSVALGNKLKKLAETLYTEASTASDPTQLFAFQARPRSEIIKSTLNAEKKAGDKAMDSVKPFPWEIWNDSGAKFLRAFFDGVAYDAKPLFKALRENR